jgi:hypothetical protein
MTDGPSAAALDARRRIRTMSKAERLDLMNNHQRQWNDLCRLAAEADSYDPQHNAALVERAQKRMARVDDLSEEFRALVHEYGLELVQVFLDHKVRSPKSIRYLIDAVRVEPYDNGQNRFRFNTAPGTKPNPAACDWDDGERYVAVGR